MCYKHEKTKNENFTLFTLDLKNEQIKALKYLSTYNFLRDNC
jgi:hypothetical protein